MPQRSRGEGVFLPFGGTCERVLREVGSALGETGASIVWISLSYWGHELSSGRAPSGSTSLWLKIQPQRDCDWGAVYFSVTVDLPVRLFSFLN